MADPEILNRSQTSALIALYREHACLWNSDLKKYKEQHARSIAYHTIQQGFESSTGIWLDIRTVKTKLQSFRSIVSKEMDRIFLDRQTTPVSTEPYVPRHDHWLELTFLCRFIRKRQPFPIDQLESLETPAPEYDGANDAASDAALAAGDPTSDPLHWTCLQHEMDCDEWCPDPSSLLTSSLPGSASHSSSTSQPQTKRRPTLQTQPQTSQSQPHMSQPHTPQSSSCSPSSSTASGKKQRRRDSSDNGPIESSNSSYQKHEAASLTVEDRDMIWAKNLVEELNQVEGEKNRLLLKIKINRLVQDALVQQIQGGTA